MKITWIPMFHHITGQPIVRRCSQCLNFAAWIEDGVYKCYKHVTIRGEGFYD